MTSYRCLTIMGPSPKFHEHRDNVLSAHTPPSGRPFPIDRVMQRHRSHLEDILGSAGLRQLTELLARLQATTE
jgi:hypothetical protein